jgi:hypothetical protein
MMLAYPSIADRDGEISALPFEAVSTPLLSGQLRVSLPVGMTREDAPLDTQKAAVPRITRDSARFVLNIQGVRFVLVAFDTYSIAGTNFPADITADLKKQNVRIQRSPKQLVDVKQIVAYEVIPKLPKASATPLVYATYTKNSDDRIHVLAFYVDGDGVSRIGDWIRLARRISISLTLGPHSDQTARRDHPLGDRHNPILLPLDDGWVVRSSPLVDGFVYRIRKLTNIRVRGSYCDLLLGDALVSQEGLEGDRITKLAGAINGVSISWRIWPNDDAVVAETIVPNLLGTLGARISCVAKDDGESANLIRMIERIHRPN